MNMNLLTDNPALYEIAFPDPEHLGGRFVESALVRHGPCGSVLDLGCGTGRDAGYLARQGYRVTGVDISPEMIAYARSQHPAVRFELGRMESYRGPEVDAVSCMDSALLYCHTNEQLAATLRNARAQLRPGGLFVAEMRNGAFFLGNDAVTHHEPDRVLAHDGVTYTARTRLAIDHRAQLLRRRRVWTWGSGTGELVQESAWRLLFPQELTYFLTEAGFEVLGLFDAPGPNTTAEACGGLAGRRLHVIARALPEGTLSC
ncbi:class I SAM-dependent methyltransferase [Longispora albida]|uniref:class I SAM-dependent methyltransferase n=1 Tax=Longispora albida TaxID=203523 RepID=UPI00037ABB0D|nr:class I SAM-dependent methyltransferase [Longispora albida]